MAQRRTSSIKGRRIANIPGGSSLRSVIQTLWDGLVSIAIFNAIAGVIVGAWVVIFASKFIDLNEWKMALPLMSFVLCIAVLLWAYRGKSLLARFDNELHGLDGERYTVAVLAELGSEGYVLLHDLHDRDAEAGRIGNIDHVLVGPAGVYCIEVKNRTKPPSGKPEIVYANGVLTIDGHRHFGDPIAQVRSGAARVAATLKENNLQLRVTPVLLFPGWFVRSDRSDEVVVTNPKMIFGILRSQPRTLTPEGVRQAYHALLPYASREAREKGE